MAKLKVKPAKTKVIIKQEESFELTLSKKEILLLYGMLGRMIGPIENWNKVGYDLYEVIDNVLGPSTNNVIYNDTCYNTCNNINVDNGNKDQDA